MPLRPSWRSARRSSGSSIVVVSFGGGATLEQVAVEGELTDQRIDLPEREGRGRMALAQEGPGAQIEDADGARVPLDQELGPDAARRDAVVGLGDLDAAVEVHGAGAEGVVAEGRRRERAKMRTLLGKHRGDLALGRAVDARVGPAGIPVIEVGLGVLQALEAQALERRALRVADPRLDFPFAIRIADPTGERRDAVVREHVAVEGIERRVVDVGREDAFAEVVEDDEGRGTAEPLQGAFVELGPGPRARVEGEEADALAA